METPVDASAVSSVSSTPVAVATRPISQTRPAVGQTRDRLAVPTKTSGVKVSLTPEARQHLSRMEAFTATIGTPKQPKTMGPPGMSLDMSA